MFTSRFWLIKIEFAFKIQHFRFVVFPHRRRVFIVWNKPEVETSNKERMSWLKFLIRLGRRWCCQKLLHYSLKIFFKNCCLFVASFVVVVVAPPRFSPSISFSFAIVNDWRVLDFYIQRWRSLLCWRWSFLFFCANTINHRTPTSFRFSYISKNRYFIFERPVGRFVRYRQCVSSFGVRLHLSKIFHFRKNNNGQRANFHFVVW